MQSVKALLFSFLVVFLRQNEICHWFSTSAKCTKHKAIHSFDVRWFSQLWVAEGWPEYFSQREHTSLLGREFCIPSSGSCNFPLGTTHLGVTTSATISLGTGSWNGLYFIQSFAPHSSLSYHSRYFSVDIVIWVTIQTSTCSHSFNFCVGL